nr:hypothetical protein KUHPSE08_20140 [Staphylococcus epidermidis]
MEEVLIDDNIFDIDNLKGFLMIPVLFIAKENNKIIGFHIYTLLRPDGNNVLFTLNRNVT